MKQYINKWLVVLIMTLPAFNSIAQENQKVKLPIDETTKLITYAKVQEISGARKDSLYRKAMSWCLSYFVNPNDVIREKDEADGKILCKARFKIMNPADKKGFATEGGSVQYTLKLLFKDGRYRMEFTEFNWKQTSYYPCEKWMDTANQYYKPEFEFYLTQLDEKVKEITAALTKSMLEKGPSKKDDW